MDRAIPIKRIISKLQSLPARREHEKHSVARRRSLVAKMVIELLPLIEEKNRQGYTFKELAEIICNESNTQIEIETVLYYISSCRKKARLESDQSSDR
jgi:hypothetical protein